MFGYLNINDLRQYMDGSFVLYDGVPGIVFADRDGDGKSVTFTPIVMNGVPFKPKSKKIDITDDKFSCRKIDLGYVQYGSNAVYVQRNPLRMYKQGIVRSHLHVSDPYIFNGVDICNHSSFAECVLGKYISYEKAINFVEGHNKDRASYAFSRHFAVAKLERGLNVLKYMDNTVAACIKGKWQMKHNTPFKDRLVHLIKEAGGPNVDA